MKVVLVNPPPYRLIEPYYDTPPYPRTAIAYLAGYLRQQNVDVEVIDCKFDQLDYEKGLERVIEAEPTIVGFTAFSNEIIQAGEFARLVKIKNKQIVTLIGGVHFTAIPEDTLREFPGFDYGIRGEGEESLYEFSKFIDEGGDLPAGVCLIGDHGNYLDGGSREPVKDQDTLPLPAWDLFRPAEEYILHTSRGCPFACTFCMNPNGRKVRPRSPQNVISELEYLYSFANPKRIFFGDEIFTVKKDRIRELCQLMIDQGYPEKFSWKCQTHVACIDQDLANLMKESNCRTTGLGIESGDDMLLMKMGKGTNSALILEAVKVLKKSTIKFESYFILGQPNETVKSALKTINFAVKLNPDIPILGIMVPYPGTKISEMVEKGEGGYKKLSTNWNDYNKQFGNSIEFDHLSRRQMELLQMYGYLKVFILNGRFLDLAKFVWQYRSEGVALVKKIVGLKPARPIDSTMINSLGLDAADQKHGTGL
jgi:anaerobic magnesium-protoporphyrin IX monomethyl ester cyclase